MREPPRILVVDDNPANLEILETRLARQGYEVVTAKDGDEALVAARAQTPDLILLDVMMPGKDGIQVCRELKADREPAVHADHPGHREGRSGRHRGRAGCRRRRVHHQAGRPRGASRAGALDPAHQGAARHVQEQAAELEEWNRTLEQRVAAQLAEIERLGSLKRFLAPQVAELILSAGDERLLESHRREITVVFCDLRGFTAFAETSEPEEVMGVLRQYHEALGELIFRHEGTLERFVGDGLVVLFNDPLPCPDPQRARCGWRSRCGRASPSSRKAGASKATISASGSASRRATPRSARIGFEGRFDYAAIGPVANLPRGCATKPRTATS